MIEAWALVVIGLAAGVSLVGVVVMFWLATR